MNKLQWDSETNGHGNTTWIAPSCWHDDGSAFEWRLRHVLIDDKAVWVEAHDAELLDGMPDIFDSLDDAKAAIEVKHESHIADLKEEV